MDQKLFASAYERIKTREDARQIALEDDRFSFSTLVSIYSQKYQLFTKKTLRFHRTPQRMAEYFQQYVNGGNLVRMAETNNIAPCLLARIVLECWLVHQQQQQPPQPAPHQSQQPLQSSMKRLSFKEAAATTSFPSTGASNEEGSATHAPPSATRRPLDKKQSKRIITNMLKDTSLISDPRLRVEVDQCVQEDDSYSPLVDKIRHAIGNEYEYILQEKLHNRDISFISEEELRVQGYTKTPDVKLDVPVIVDGKHVVNWIESKGSFGDERSHSTYLHDQYHGYVNRYGPGLVIYWFGYCESIEQGDGIHVSHGFPLNLKKINI